VADGRRVRWGALALGLAAAAAAAPVPWPAPVAAFLLVWALGFAPGALVAPGLAPRAGAAGRTLFALATAPFLAGAPAALMLALGVSPAAAARTVLGLIAAAALVVAFAGRAGAAGEPAREQEGRVPWLAAALWTALVAALLLGNPWLPPRSDGWFHAAVTLQMAERGVPPEDPYFAGLRLLYFWGYHAWAMLWIAIAPALPVWAPLIALNLAGAVAVMLGVGLLARRLGAGDSGVWGAVAVATLGYAPFSWIWIGVRSFTGEVVGWDEVKRLVTMGVTPALPMMGSWTLHSSMAFFGDKFLVLTPFALGLAQFTLLLLTLLDFIARPGRREGTALGLAFGAALFIHSVVGWSGALLAGGWWWWALWRSRIPGERHLRHVLLPLIAVFAAVVALLSPYLAITTVGKQETVAPGFSSLALGTWLLSGLLLVPAGMAWLWNARHRVAGARDLLVFAVLLTVAGLSIWLPGLNQSKFFNLLFLLLAAPAGLWWVELLSRARGPARRLLVGGLAVAIVPTIGMALVAFATERGQFGEAWEHPRAGELEGMRWARANTARDAIFVDPDLSLDLPVRARRSVMTGGEPWEQNWRYPTSALEVRRHAAMQLGALAPPTPEVEAFLRARGRPVFVTLRRRGADGPARWDKALAGDHPGYRLVYRNDEIAIFEWRPAS
jgi:hypothetical protein